MTSACQDRPKTTRTTTSTSATASSARGMISSPRPLICRLSMIFLNRAYSVSPRGNLDDVKDPLRLPSPGQDQDNPPIDLGQDRPLSLVGR